MMKKDVSYYEKELKKYYDNVEFEFDLLRAGNHFIFKEDLKEMEEVLQEGIKKKEVKNAKVKCACGNEMKVVLYKGYYDSFKYLQCSNENCEYLDFHEESEEWRGDYA